MKIRFFFTILALSLAVANVSARDHHEGRHHDRPTYIVSNNKVFYDGRELKGASGMNFAILTGGYAKDPWNVYYRGEKMRGASAGTFSVLSDGYAKDSWNVYFRGAKIKDASATTFKVLTDA